MVGGAPVRLLTTVMKGIHMLELGLSQYLRVGVLFGTSYSSRNPDLANYQSGQDLLNQKYMNQSNPELNFIKWIYDEDIDPITMNERLMEIASDNNMDSKNLMEEIWNTKFVHLLRYALAANVTNPCSGSYSEYKEGLYDKLCQVFYDNDLQEVVHNVEYPIEFCYSVDDELVPYDGNIPHVHFNPEYLSTYESQGTHSSSSHQCFLNAISYLVSSNISDLTFEEKHSNEGCSRTTTEGDHNMDFEL